jgi:hypothetical protein
MVIPQSDILTTNRLGKIFSNTVATYKFFWFVSIMQIHFYVLQAAPTITADAAYHNYYEREFFHRYSPKESERNFTPPSFSTSLSEYFR